MALFLRDEEVRQIVFMDDMLGAIESMQARFGQGEDSNLPRRKIIAKGGMLAVMGGGLFYDGVMGVKTYTVVKGVYSFQVSLYGTDTGRLLCYTQGNRPGQLRNGASTALAVKYLANLVNGGLSDVFGGVWVMAAGGLLLVVAAIVSLASAPLRGIYFPRGAGQSQQLSHRSADRQSYGP